MVEPTQEEIFIERVLSQWDTAYARKHEQAEILRIILNKIKLLEDGKK